MAHDDVSLDQIEIFSGLAPEQLEQIKAKLSVVRLSRNEVLLRQGDPADAIFICVTGRFLVFLNRSGHSIAEIGPGSLIGEVAFFSDGKRTATVIAERDCIVLKLSREDFEELSRTAPAIWTPIARTLANRLAYANTTRNPVPRPLPPPRTVAICQGGMTTIPSAFLSTLREIFEDEGRVAFLGSADVKNVLYDHHALDGNQATHWFNTLETRYDIVFYICDGERTAWSEKAIRQADLVLIVTRHADNDVSMNPVERFAFALHRPRNLRLVLWHEKRGVVSGTGRWLNERPVHIHHHVALDERKDLARLSRFITGNALGLVAAGGGAFCAAHIGLYQALMEDGFEFDIIGGTSGGGAMAAAFALGASPEDIGSRVEDIFISRKALRRWTWPRYGLVDHKVFDAALAEHFTEASIEDMWLPYFAASTNLSRNELHVHRRGKIWEAIRASGGIPGLLPPFFNDRGDILVDGALIDNVPIGAMRALKDGPNVVISFEAPRLEQLTVPYGSLPSRKQLLMHLLSPMHRDRLPKAPGPRTILMRSIAAGRRTFEAQVDGRDLLLMPPVPQGTGALDWHLHKDIARIGYEYGKAELYKLRSSRHPVMSALRDRK